MAANSTIFLKNLLKKYDMPCKPVSEWDEIDCHAKFSKCLKAKSRTVSGCLNDKCLAYDIETKKMTFVDSKDFIKEDTGEKVKYVDKEWRWNKTDWDFVLANLDRNLERKLGYI